MALRLKLVLLLALGSASCTFADVSFNGSNRILDCMMRGLNRAQASIDSGDLSTAYAYTESVLMDREQKVFVDLSMAQGRQKDAAQRAFTDGLQMWQDALGNSVKFKFVESAVEADVVVLFSPDVSSEGMNVAGNIKFHQHIGQEANGSMRASLQALIQVRTSRPDGRGDMSFELMRHACAHELGHLLGLSDSYCVGDLMGPLDLRNPATRIADDEIFAIRQMRQEAVRLRGEVVLSAWTSHRR